MGARKNPGPPSQNSGWTSKIINSNNQKILQFLGLGKEEKPTKQVLIYARVSAIKQKEDLNRQIASLKAYAKEKGWQIIQVYSDIASGLNDDRKNWLRLISDIPKFQPDFLLCSYRDRIARFGTGVIEQMCKIYGTELVELNRKETNEEEDLVQNIIAMLYSFSGKLYRQRRGKKEQSAVSETEFLYKSIRKIADEVFKALNRQILEI